MNMPKIIFEDSHGQRTEVEAKVGDSVMMVAVQAGVEGILADCGGGCSCATCHCYVQPGIFPDPDPIESQMLECVMHPDDDCRLSCQLTVTDAMDGLLIRLPESQT